MKPAKKNSKPSSLTRRIPCSGIQGPNSKWEHRTSTKTGISTILQWRNELRGDLWILTTTMGKILNGMFFFQKDSSTVDLANNIVQFPDITLQLRPTNGKFKTKMMQLHTAQRTIITSRQQLFVPVVAEDDLGTVTGTTEAFPPFERRTQLLVSPALTQIKNRQSHVEVTNPFEHIITLQPGTTVTIFKVLIPNQVKNVQLMTIEQLNHITEEADQIINQLF